MIKMKSLMIAAAALLSVSVPTMASAGKIGEKFKELRVQRDYVRAIKLQNKQDLLNGDITRAEFKLLRQNYLSQIDEIRDTLDEYRATR